MKKLCIFFFVGLLSFSCGIDNYLYLYPVSQISIGSDNQVSFELPNNQLEGYFKNYTIFYRIYKSAENRTGSIHDYQTINPRLNEQINRIAPYTKDGENPLVVQSLFETLNFRTLALENVQINNVLSSTARGKKISIDFNTQATGINYPILTIDSSKYKIVRSITNPIPSSSFIYSSTMMANTNADVENGGEGYAYVCLYILAAGIDDNASIVLSTPAFLGVYKLPNILN